VPLLMMDRPESVLVICFGVGNTVHAASLHPSIERLEIADLSSDILERAYYFRATNGGVLEDPRVRVFIDDGRQHLVAAQPASYDLVTLEPPPIAFAGVSSLYSSEFYALAKSRLRRGGYLTQWLPIHQLTDAALSAIRSFVDVFPSAVLLSGDRRDLILLGENADGAVTIDPEEVAAHLDARPLVREDLESAKMGTLTEIFGTFVANSEALHQATAKATPVTDDDPIMEHAVVSPFTLTTLPPEVFRVEGVAAWCPTCAAKASLVPRLDTYLELLAGLYATDDFLTFRTFAPARLTLPVPPDPDGKYAATIAASPYLTSLLPR
jgi:spermidine synthase